MVEENVEKENLFSLNQIILFVFLLFYVFIVL